MVHVASPHITSKPGPQPGVDGQSSPRPDADGGPPDWLQTLAQGAHETIDRVAEQVTPQVQRLEARMSGATEQLDERADEWRETTDAWLESLRCTVRENPLAALGAALAVGLVVARLSR